MSSQKYEEKVRHTDIAIGIAVVLTICCAILTGFLSYSFNAKLATSIIVGLAVIIQGFITWWFSGRNKSKETV